MKKQLITLAALAGGFVIGASALVAFASTPGWTSAPATPPTSNVAAPINVGVNGVSAIQEKFDSLQIDENLGVVGKLVAAKLQILSGASISTGTVLTNDGAGNASWAKPSVNFSTRMVLAPSTGKKSLKQDLGTQNFCAIAEENPFSWNFNNDDSVACVVSTSGGNWTLHALMDQNDVDTGIVCRAVCVGGGAVTAPIVDGIVQDKGKYIVFPDGKWGDQNNNL